VRLAGGSWSSTTYTYYNFTLPICDGQVTFTLDFSRSLAGSNWFITLDSVTPNGQVCNSTYYAVTGLGTHN
jgi:hypothetical protein